MTLNRHLRRLRLTAIAFLTLIVAISALGHLLSFGFKPQAQVVSGVAAQATLLERMERAALVLSAARRGVAWEEVELQHERAVLADAMSRFEATLSALRRGGTLVDPAGGTAVAARLPASALLHRVDDAWKARRLTYRALLADDGAIGTADHDRTATDALQALLNDLTREVEEGHHRSNRTYGWALLVLLAGVGSLYAFSTVTSIRRLRRIDRLRELALEEASLQLGENRLLTQVAARTSNLALITDAQRRIVWVNASFERTTGWTLAEVRGRRPGDLLQGPQTDRRKIDFMRRELQEGRGFSQVELVNYDRHGNPYWVEIDVQPLLGDDGSISHFVAIESVITERRRVLSDLTRARDTAEQGSLAKTRFMARASHELRTPLNGVLGLAQVLLSDERVRDATVRSRLRTIAASGKHMAVLLDDLLDLSRVEADELVVARDVVDLHGLVTSVIQTLSAQADAARVTVSCDLGDSARWAWGDEVRVRQIALNLLSNAIKYNRPGGQVLIASERRAQDIELSFLDDGPGLSPSQLAQLFEPFNRLGAERTPTPGSGIGLVIARRLAELMQGGITVESSPGGGSRFVLRLHDAQAQAGPVEPPDSGHGSLHALSSRCTGTVLHVEDNPVNALVFEACLARMPGVDVQTAKDGREAMELARRRPPDLVVLDLNLPDTDGFQLSAALRGLPGGASVPHCLLSADSTSVARRRADELAFARVWPKPLDARAMLLDIEALLTREPARLAGPEPCPRQLQTQG